MADQTKRRTRRFGIRARVIALTVLFTFFIAATVLFSSVYYLSTQMRRSNLQAAEYQLKTACAGILQRVREIDALASWCTVNTSVRTAMLTGVSSGFTSTVYPLLTDEYNSMSTGLYVQRFLVSSTNGCFTMMGTASARSAGVTQENLSLLPGLGEGEEDTAWEMLIDDPLMQPGNSMQGIPVTRTVSSSNGAYTMSVYISVSPALITDILKEFSLEDGSTLYWCMGDTVYLADGGTLSGFSVEGLEPERETDAGVTLDEGTMLYSVRGDDADYSVIACPVGLHGLYLAEAIVDVPLTGYLPELASPILIVLLAILLFGGALAALLHDVVSKPIRALQRQIETLAGGQFTANPDIEWNHELGDVGRGINDLSRNVTALMDRRVEDEKKRLDLEFQMLQNQINPHFIYNTLNSIKWMATIQHAPGIAEMVTALARLLKTVSKSNRKLIPLHQEFDLLNDYFTIQRYRYGGTIAMEIRFLTEEAAVRDCLIPQFSLQPLAENAIFHGIEPKGCAGEIVLSVLLEEGSGDVLLRLSDDGVGMTQEQIGKALLEPEGEGAEEKFRHVGLWNVHRRLQYSFGPGYGLELESRPGEGTTVTVRLPGQNGKKGEAAL